MTITIKFKYNDVTSDQFIDVIRSTAKSQGWSRTDGYKEYCKLAFNAKLRTSVYDDITSIKFSNQIDFDKFIALFNLSGIVNQLEIKRV